MVDLMPYIADKCYEHVYIDSTSSEWSSQYSLDPPRNMPREEVERTFCVCKIGGHYDFILNEEAASGGSQ